jgi:hypothetical protein
MIGGLEDWMGCCDGKFGVETVARGVRGLTRAAVVTVARVARGEAPPAWVEERRGVCRGCGYVTKNQRTGELHRLSECRLCRCNVLAKTVVPEEECCAKQWGKANGKERESVRT